MPNPVVSVAWGRKGNADHQITSPAVAALAPGQTRRISIPFELDALSFGRYDLAGRVTGTSAPVRFQQATSTWPWGLFVVAVVVLLLMLRGLWKVLRRRITARKASKRAATELEPEPDLVAVPDEADWEEDEDDEWATSDFDS